MNSGQEHLYIYLFIFMPCTTWGRPLSVMKVLHAPQQGQGEAKLKKHINIHRNFPDIGREYVNEATKQ